jgi:hypothetical protein
MSLIFRCLYVMETARRRIDRAASDPSSGRSIRCLIFHPSAVRTSSPRFAVMRWTRKPFELPLFGARTVSGA